MLRFKADIRTLLYMAVTTLLFWWQWQQPALVWYIYAVYLFLSVAVTVIAHNHNHVPIFRSKSLNGAVDYWLTVFYGFPTFAWIPTHNMNHHSLNNKAGDYTITYRFTEKNNLPMLLAYPSVSSFFQQKPISDYLKLQWRNDKSTFWYYISQYAVLVAWIGVALLIDWKKALLYVVIPQQFGLYAVLIFNYIQHVHADEESEWNHSRNFTGLLNKMLFNNGLHTVHHERAGTHWSNTPEAHAKVAHLISPALIERSFWWYMFRNYILGMVNPKFRTVSMRLERMKQSGGVAL